MYSKLDTIAAIATPLGTGGIAVIRISGEDAVKIAEKTARSQYLQSFKQMKFGRLFNLSLSGSQEDAREAQIELAERTFYDPDAKIKVYPPEGYQLKSKPPVREFAPAEAHELGQAALGETEAVADTDAAVKAAGGALAS